MADCAALRCPTALVQSCKMQEAAVDCRVPGILGWARRKLGGVAPVVPDPPCANYNPLNSPLRKLVWKVQRTKEHIVFIQTILPD